MSDDIWKSACEDRRDAEISRLRTENEALRRRVNEWQQEASNLNLKLASASFDANDLRKRIVESEDYRYAAQQAEKRVAELEAELMTAVEDVKALPQKTVDELMPIIGPLKARAEAAEKRVAELEAGYVIPKDHAGHNTVLELLQHCEEQIRKYEDRVAELEHDLLHGHESGPIRNMRARAEQAEAELKILRESAHILADAEIENEALRKRVGELQSAGVHLIARAEQAEAQLAIAREASDKLGMWLSAALDDPSVCEKMKADINAWFAALARTAPPEEA